MYEKNYGKFHGKVVNRNYEISHSKKEFLITNSTKDITPEELADLLAEELRIKVGSVCVHSITYTYIKDAGSRERKNAKHGYCQTM